MEQLSELEKRVLEVIQKNKELQEVNEKLKAENASLHENSKHLEASLMKKSENTKTLETEKASVKTTIEELLSTIKTLEKSK